MALLAEEKRLKMATGGEPFPDPSTRDDPDIDAVFSIVDTEVQHVIDNDTLALLAKEKRLRMLTGGGSFPGPSTRDDPDIDSVQQ